MKIAVKHTFTITVEALQALWCHRTGRGARWFDRKALKEAGDIARRIFIDSGSSGIDCAIEEAREYTSGAFAHPESFPRAQGPGSAHAFTHPGEVPEP